MRRNKFSLSHYRLTSFNMGELVPVSWFEVVPGDSVQMSTSSLVRLSTLLRPVMHPVFVKTHHWFVPNIQIWANFYDFITGGDDGLDATVHPNRTFGVTGTLTDGSLRHHLGMPAGSYSGSTTYSALPIRAYQHIWNEFYRDQDLQTEATLQTTDGTDGTETSLQNVCWEKDYFTTARPWESKGSDVSVPIYGDGIDFMLSRQGGASGTLQDDGTGDVIITGTPSAADLQTLTTSSPFEFDIDDLKLGLGLQRFQERMGRHGSRYAEYLMSLGVKPDDLRLRRPLYLGGGRQTINMSEIAATAANSSPATAVGDLKGHGIGAMRTRRWRKFFTEHGIVMTLMCVQPKIVYEDTMERAWFRTTKEDYYQRELEFIGDQAITNKEVYPLHASPEGTFGYQERYSEYKHKNSTVSGSFSDGGGDDDWHYARQWATDPALNSSFVSCVPAERAHADAAEDTVKAMVMHSIQARRPMARSPKPGTGL